MVDASLTLINAVSVHAVGNKLLGEELELSNAVLQLAGDKIRSQLLTYFFSGFNSPEYHSFDIEKEDASPNLVYSLVMKFLPTPICCTNVLLIWHIISTKFRSIIT